MRVESAEMYLIDGAYPALALVIDGRDVQLVVEHNKLVHYGGFICLGPEWYDDLPPRRLPAKPGFTRQQFYGCTDNPDVLKLFRRFMYASNNWREAGQHMLGEWDVDAILSGDDPYGA